MRSFVQTSVSSFINSETGKLKQHFKVSKGNNLSLHQIEGQTSSNNPHVVKIHEQSKKLNEKGYIHSKHRVYEIKTNNLKKLLSHQSNDKKECLYKVKNPNMLQKKIEEPVKSKPVKSKQVESKQVKSKQDKSKPVKRKQVESKPVKSKQVKGKPVESKPVESKPVKSKPVEKSEAKKPRKKLVKKQ
jgi:ribonuclease E